MFTIEVTEDFLSFIDECALAVEVWGHRRSGFLDMGMGAGAEGDPVEGKRHKSFPEKLVLVIYSKLLPSDIVHCTVCV